MYSEVAPFLLYSVSSVHVGSGSELGVVDLPIQRERHTGYPKIESSSLKGAIRAAFRRRETHGDKLVIAFGSEPGEDRDGKPVAAAVGFADARILLFPVRSLRGVFAFVTCPHVLTRFNYELETYAPGYPLLPVPPANTVSSDLLQVAKEDQIVLEEYTYEMAVDPITAELGKRLDEIVFPTETARGRLASRLAVLTDDQFGDFVQLSTEVNARIQLNPLTGTNENLWYEENLPPETVLYSFVFAGAPRVEEVFEPMPEAGDVLAFVQDEEVFPPVFQLGGNSTLGRGMMRRIWLPKEGV